MKKKEPLDDAKKTKNKQKLPVSQKEEKKYKAEIMQQIDALQHELLQSVEALALKQATQADFEARLANSHKEISALKRKLTNTLKNLDAQVAQSKHLDALLKAEQEKSELNLHALNTALKQITDELAASKSHALVCQRNEELALAEVEQYKRIFEVATGKYLGKMDGRISKINRLSTQLVQVANESHKKGWIFSAVNILSMEKARFIVKMFIDQYRDEKTTNVFKVFIARYRRHGWSGAVNRLEKDWGNQQLERAQEKGGMPQPLRGYLADVYIQKIKTRIENAVLDLADSLARQLQSVSHTVIDKPVVALEIPAVEPREIVEHIPERYAKARVVVYTAVINHYDELRDPAVVPDGWHFVAFSDVKINSKIWQTRPLNYIDSDPVRSARFVKINAHHYFKDYDYSIWLDANLQPITSLLPLLPKLKNNILGLMRHPHRNCVYVEGAECIKRNKDKADSITPQLERYRETGFPENYGLWETGLMLRKHNDPRCIQLMVSWWQEVFIGSRRDQISLPIVLRQYGEIVSELGVHGKDEVRHNKYIEAYKHTQNITSKIALEKPDYTKKDVAVDALSVDIVVCVFNGEKETRACLGALSSAMRMTDRLIIVDDASGAETAAMLDTYIREHKNTVLIRNEKNLGYTKSANIGMRAATAKFILLLNSDTVVEHAILTKLLRCAIEHPMLGIVGPLSNAASWQTIPILHAPENGFMVNKLPLGMTPNDMGDLCEKHTSGVTPFVVLVNGFCFMVKREVIDRIGYFDEDLFPIGYGEEDDFCLRANDAGYACGIATNAYVYHEKSVSFTSVRRLALVKTGGKSLRSKYGLNRVNISAAISESHPALLEMRRAILAALSKESASKGNQALHNA